MATFPYPAAYPDGVAYATIPPGSSTVNVATSAQLTTALNNATAGQRIVLASGTYSGAFTVSKAGTSTAGISIEAASQGGAVFASGSTWNFTTGAAYVTLKGVSLPYELSSGNTVQFRNTAHHCRVTRCLFGPTSVGTPGTNKTPFIFIGDKAEHIRIDHNEFRNKANPGNAIVVDGDRTVSPEQVCKHIQVDHNILRSIKPEVPNEKEPIRFGWSGQSKSHSYSVIERNYLADCICEPEVISVKASSVRVTGNTIYRSIGGLVYRHGTAGILNDNYIIDGASTFGSTIGSGGLRFYDRDHEVAYNYVQGVYGGNFQNALMLDSGDAEGSSTNLTAHWRVVNALVEKNVLVGNPTGIVIGHNYSSAPTGCTIRGNVVAQAGTGTAITQKIAPVNTTMPTSGTDANTYSSTPSGAGLAQDSLNIWRKAGVGPRLTYLQAGDVGVSGDPNDTDGTGALVGDGGGTPPPPSPQTVTAAGIPSAQAFGTALVQVVGASTTRPPGSVDTLLGINTVLGQVTLGYTQGTGEPPPPPGSQTVSAAGRIASVAAFGVPALSVVDGPQSLTTTGIVSGEAFGRPRVSGGNAPPPAPGGVLVPTVFAVAANGEALTPLPFWTKISLSPVRNSPGALSIEYPAGAPGFSTLHDGVSATPLKALEIRVWLGGNATGALGGWLVQKAGDDLEPGSRWVFSGHFHEWILAKALVYPQAISEANKKGELRFVGANAGLILSTVLSQAQERGALPLVSRDFSTTHDSNGQPWAKSVSSLNFAPKTTVQQVADKLVELGLCEYEISAARVWRAHNPGTRGVDRTAGAAPLTFAHAVNLSEHARRESSKDAGTAVLAAGAEGFYADVSSPTAQAELGWRAEVATDAGQVASADGVQAVAATYLEVARAGVAEYAAGVEFSPGSPLPLLDYGVGDWAYTWAGDKRRKLRIAQLVLEFSNDAPPAGKVALNDLITDKLTALYQRLNAISAGDAVVGTSTPTPGGSGEDTIPPAAPQGVTVSSTIAYQIPGEAVTRALVDVGWQAVTTNAYADAVTAGKAQAATAISDRFILGQQILEDWTWAGAPAVVGLYNDALLEEWKTDPTNPGGDNNTLGGEALAWLKAYAVTHSGGGAVTDDVAHYRVQYRYLGAAPVGSGSGTLPPDWIPTTPRDPNEVTDTSGWFEPTESPTTNTRLTFGEVIGGRSIGVRVNAVDRVGNQGPWSVIVAATSAVDDQPPPKPSKPIAVPWFETANVTWDGKGAAGEDLFAAANDLASGGRVEVHMGEGIDFTPHRPLASDGKTADLSQSITYKTDFQWAGTTNIVDIPRGVTVYFRFVAVDRNGNASDPSDTSDGVLAQQLVNIQLGPGSVARMQIVDGEIVNGKIANLAVNDANIANVNVGKLTAGTMTAVVVIGGRFETPLTNGHQVQLDNGGLRMYRNGTVIGRWQTFDGSMMMTGQFQSNITGQRVVINPGGSNPDTIRLYPSASETYSSIDSVDFNGGNIAGIRIVGSGILSTANRGMVVVRDQYASLIHGRTDLSYWGSEIWVEQNFTRNKSATVDLIVDERLVPVGGERRVAMIHYNTAGQPINATGLYYKKTTFNGGEPQFYGNGMDIALVFAPGHLYVRNNPNNDFRDLTAKGLFQASGKAFKRDIRDLTEPSPDTVRRLGTARSGRAGRPVPAVVDDLTDPVATLRRAQPKRYRWHDDPDDRPDRVGFIAEELPAPIRVSAVQPNTDPDAPPLVVESLDYSALTTVLVAAVQRIEERVSELETRTRPGPPV